MHYRTVPYASLRRNPEINARGGSAIGNIEGLIAQIRQNGMRDPLCVRGGAETGIYEIIDGDRRHAAIGSLVEAGNWFPPGDEQNVPVLDAGDIDDAQAREISIALNTEREGLTPIAEAVAITRLADSGMDAATIATHFARPERHIRQRLALGRLSPEILEAAKAGTISLSTAEAFTLAKDQKQQRKIWKGLGGNANTHAVRAAITGEKLDAGSVRGKFIAEAYAAAGGPIVEDLFGEQLWLADGKLAAKLFEQRLAETVKAYEADGWSEVKLDREGKTYTHSLSRTEPKGAPELDAAQQKRADALCKEIGKLEAQMEEAEEANDFRARSALEDAAIPFEEELAVLTARHFTAGQKRHAGVLIIATPNRFEIIEGITKPPKKGAKARSEDDGDDPSPLAGEGGARSAPDEGPSQPEEADFTGALKADLAQIMGGALQMAIAEKPGQALRLMTAALINKALSQYGSSAAFALSPRSYSADSDAHQQFSGKLKLALEPFADGHVDLSPILDKLDAMTEDDRTKLFAMLLADTLDWGIASPRDLIRRLDPEPGHWWRADAQFFNKLNRAQLCAALADLDPADALARKNRKKPDLVARCVEALTPTGWLPDTLRAPSYAGPGSPIWADKKAAEAAEKIAAE